MSFIRPLPNNADSEMNQLLQELRNAVNGKVNISGYTTAKRDTITTWITGDVIFNEDISGLQRYDGNAWANL